MQQAREEKRNADREVLKKKLDLAVLKFKNAQAQQSACAKKAVATTASYVGSGPSRQEVHTCSFENGLTTELLLAMRESEDDSVKLFLLSLVERVRALPESTQRRCLLQVLEVVMVCEESKIPPCPSLPLSPRLQLSAEMEVCTEYMFSFLFFLNT